MLWCCVGCGSGVEGGGPPEEVEVGVGPERAPVVGLGGGLERGLEGRGD